MKIFNLTDVKPPFRAAATNPRVVRLGGIVISPGESGDASDLVHKGSFSGLVRRGIVSIDKLPEWYQVARRKASDERTLQQIVHAIEEPKPEKKEHFKTKKAKKKNS